MEHKNYNKRKWKPLPYINALLNAFQLLDLALYIYSHYKIKNDRHKGHIACKINSSASEH